MATLSNKTVAAIQWSLLVALVGLLEFGTRFGIVDPLTMVPFVEIWHSLVRGLNSGRFPPHLLWSGELMLRSFVLAIILGIPAGYWLSRADRIYGWIRPYIESYYCLPIFVFYPVAVAMMGLSRWPALIIVWLWAVGGVIVNTVIGFRRVPASLEKYSRSIYLSEWQKLLHVRVPAAIPSILTGVKLAAVYSISGTIGVEFILSSRGIGRLINYAFNDFKTAEMYSLIFLVIGLAAICHSILDLFERQMTHLRGHAVDHGGHLAKLPSAETRLVSAAASRLEVLIVPLLILAAWYALSRVVGADMLATPYQAVQSALADAADGSLVQVLKGTIRDTLVSFGLSAAIGIFLGIIFGRIAVLRRIFSPYITAVYTVPKIVLFPILLFVFGLGPISRVAYGILHAAPAIMLFTIAGIQAVNQGHLKYAASIQLSQWKIFRQITLPSALPEIVSGLRFGLGMCFLGILVAEMLFGASEGAGFVIVYSSVTGDTARMMALVVLVFAFVLSLNYLMALLRKVTMKATE